MAMIIHLAFVDQTLMLIKQQILKFGTTMRFLKVKTGFIHVFELEERHINFCVSGPTFFNESSFTSLSERKNQLALKALIQCFYWHFNHYFVQIVNKPKDYTQKILRKLPSSPL